MHPDARHGRLVGLPLTGVAGLALVAATWYVHQRIADPAVLAFRWIGDGDRRQDRYAALEGEVAGMISRGPFAAPVAGHGTVFSSGHRPEGHQS